MWFFFELVVGHWDKKKILYFITKIRINASEVPVNCKHVFFMKKGGKQVLSVYLLCFDTEYRNF